ncbi:MAG: hypothetical protein BWX81_01746 [Spirochaetes bacterium ADurb.Bin110]|nr:MAG: hypothetical protein BWX81_01746 [Spirochaetes bacterium ADurb.Bin110]
MTPQELSKIDYEAASQMILAYTIDAKKYEKEIAELKSQAQEWKAKAAEAQTKGASELSGAALQRASELESKAQQLSVELNAIRRDIEQLREALPIIKAKQRRVDPDQLLAELSMIVGLDAFGEQKESASKSDSTTSSADKDSSTVKNQDSSDNKNPASPVNPASLADQALDDALAELKKKMGLL